ncbi:MAG: Asp-tRNA(Asn)/Glu-tRNA(Gln) amidotransferase subunit GatC [Deltaproteobacteria bacterium]|nr:Asp-tRNA(Asn)/Glu-tRNA(Gln) amidotransferase subunit GatC [Deltaproteobacteria bacterium]
MAITAEDIRYIAELARLHLAPEEAARYAEHAGRIVEYVAQLNRLATASVEPTAHAVEAAGFSREDLPRPSDAAAAILANAPARDGDLFTVPKVLG